MITLSKLLKKIPRVQLIYAPTPLHPLKKKNDIFHSVNQYIKRDDLTGLGPGGNKIRSLEFILGDAMDKSADFIITSGPLQSNLCALTAAACSRLSLPCLLVFNGEEPKRLEGNLLLDQLLGAELRYVGNCDSSQRAINVELERQRLLNEGYHPYVVENGATTGYGVLGYTAAVEELLSQCREKELSNVTIFAPGGNGGVAAGLLYGNALLDFPFRIVVISVEDEKKVLIEHIEKVLRETEEIIGVPCPNAVPELGEIVDDYRGSGWGKNTKESEKMVLQFARDEGIFIENIYNSKVVVGMKDWIEKGKVMGTACYLHTGGFGSLFSQY